MSKIIGRQGAVTARNAKKITFKISTHDFVVSVICFVLSRAKLLTYMNPFGMAAYAALFSNTGWFYALLCTGAGIIISKGDYTSLRYILALGVATPVLGLWDKRTDTLFKALVMSISYFCVSLCLLLAEGFLIYDFIYFSFEAFICFVCVYLIVDIVPVLENYNSRTRLSAGEITALASMAALLVLSCSSLPSFFGMNLSALLAVFIILAINLKGDCMMGAAVGVIMGLVVSMGSYESASVVGAYAFASFMSGLFKKYSRLGVLLGFTLANAVVTAFLNDTGTVLIDPIEVLVAGFIFVTLPQKLLKVFTDFSEKASGAYTPTNRATAAGSSGALAGVYIDSAALAGSLRNLSDIYSQDSKPRRPGKRYITGLFNKCADNVCSGCGLRFGCWQSVGHNNYQYMLAMLEQANKHGSIDVAHMPKKFAERCIKKEEFVRVFNLVYNIYQADKLWLDKTCRLQKLMAEQLSAVCTSVERLQANSLLECNSELSYELACVLDKHKCHTGNVYVMQEDSQIRRVWVEFGEEEYPADYTDSMAAVISDALEQPLVFGGEVLTGGQNKVMQFVPAKKYSVRSARLQMQKHGEYVCGDTSAEITKPDGNYMAIISDGMGSGAEAGSESKATVAMLVNLIEAGADVQTAVELVNTSLIVRSQKDCFATLDILDTDLDTGRLVISKIGAAPTYIKTDSFVKKLECSSLPVGILADIQPQNYTLQTDGSAVVVMVSDGISNTTIRNMYEQDWVHSELSCLQSSNPDAIANRILNSAISRCGGKCSDDMTVVVAVIYKNE